ncbi:MAG TPA: aryl-sulfate sulfotransferase [Burkholderiaceae bacterium]
MNTATRLRHLAAGIALACTAGAHAGPSVYPEGTTRLDPSRAWPSYVLFTGGDETARLVDLDGKTVHTWRDVGGFAPLFIDPALVGGERGRVLVTLENSDGRGVDLVPGRAGPRVSKTVGELDWNGQLKWQFGPKAPGGLAQQHHDWARLPNGNTLVLANLRHPVPGFKQPEVLDDVAYEVDASGAIVWRWVASEHLEEFGFSAATLALIRASDNADYLHLNNLKPVGPNHWFDAGDKRFAPDNLILHSRNANVIAIVDRHSGHIVWTLGPDYPAIPRGAAARRVPRPVDQISGQHDAQIIPAGLPGAGNLLVFDNQGEAGYPPVELPTTGGSRVLEIDPVTRQVVWQYTAEDSGQPSWAFRSTHISAARRLPNGNTFIDEGQSGRLFQVTREGDIVWEYVNPYPRIGKDPGTGKATVNHQLYRAQPVPLDWAPAGTPHTETALRTGRPGEGAAR